MVRPQVVSAVQMQGGSNCSRCGRLVQLLASAFLDEDYKPVCVGCMERYYNELAKTA